MSRMNSDFSSPSAATGPLPDRSDGAPAPALLAAARARIAGPGGCYNAGNALGLGGGLLLAVLAASEAGGPTIRGGLEAARQHLAGGADAICVSIAMLVFFWSGELYHRAWAGGAPPDDGLNRRGDLSSGIGAILLGLGLFLMGEPLLAATSGLLHAAGKFGSAAVPHGATGSRWPELFRIAVLLSRVPAVALVLITLLAAPAGIMAMASPLLLLVCYGLWLRADLMLLRAG